MEINKDYEKSESPIFLWRCWQEAVQQVKVVKALEEIFKQVGQAIEQRGPQCWVSGRCCHFESFGHRLYVSGLEIAWVLAELSKERRDLADGLEISRWVEGGLQDGCVFQQGHCCGIHAYRPLGCRLFFCQRGTQDWQHEIYEVMLGRLRRVHEQFDLPYRYMEWRMGLAEAVGCGLLSADPAGQ